MWIIGGNLIVNFGIKASNKIYPRTELFLDHSWESGRVKGESLFWEFMSHVKEISVQNQRISIPDRKRWQVRPHKYKEMVAVFPLRE